MTLLARFEGPARVGFRHVVMPVDFSELSWRVLPLARTVAQTFGADLVPLHVDTASPWREPDDVSQLTLSTAPFGRRVQVDVVAARDPAATIARYARRKSPALIAMSTHGHTGIGEMTFGSVCEAVLRHTDGPVLTVGPEFDVGRHSVVRRLVVCLDSSADSLVVVPDALAWGEALDVPVELMTVTPGRALAAEVERLVAELSRDHPRVSSLALNGGRPGSEIVRYADAMPGTLLAMSTHARSALPRALVGSVVMHVARHTTSGVLLRRRPLSSLA